MRKTASLAQVVDVGFGDCLEAFMLRDLHSDFEDDLQLAAGKRIKVDFLVTSDEQLIRHAPIPVLSAGDFLKLLRSENATKL